MFFKQVQHLSKRRCVSCLSQAIADQELLLNMKRMITLLQCDWMKLPRSEILCKRSQIACSGSCLSDDYMFVWVNNLSLFFKIVCYSSNVISERSPGWSNIHFKHINMIFHHTFIYCALQWIDSQMISLFWSPSYGRHQRSMMDQGFGSFFQSVDHHLINLTIEKYCVACVQIVFYSQVPYYIPLSMIKQCLI